MNDNGAIKALYRDLNTISAYRDIAALEPIAGITYLLDSACDENAHCSTVLDDYSAVYFTLESEGFSSLGAYLASHLLYDDTVCGIAVAGGKASDALLAAAKRETDIFARLAALPCADIKSAMASSHPEWADAIAALPEWSNDTEISWDKIYGAYVERGAGSFAKYRAFVWSAHTLTPISDPDTGDSELFGYEDQREEVRLNTKALLDGKRVNNMLLYGEAGTGKSATVKNLLNVAEFGDLRIIEIDKEQLSDMPDLIRMLGGRRQKFILFIDDLSFENAEGGYSVLKTVLEGGLEKRPDNVVIYATSNRRHLMRETFSERGGDEVNLHETIEERTALSERFGIRVLFVGLNQDDYLALVENLAGQSGIDMPREQLWKAAIQWEREHASRTPRSAQQFVSYLQSK